ncbi:AAA domain-containing protein [Ferrimonas balearica]|uniref:AAA domain-containing protein n=1 Tax=Ferrimonas balearica TaxID=44012 RepID=UPI001C5A68CB|nr:AAA domain-containing protein [Ferrimonas balearica]MBW3166476.1 AAA family ATPase [Ferrimonas balearica]
MRQELANDYQQHEKLHERMPLFHRIGFEQTSIYLTKATFYNSLPVTGKGLKGHYRVFSWTDIRAKAFLGFELGQQSPALGTARLIGSFKPDHTDLTQVRYQTFQGKAYFPSAESELTGSSRANTDKKPSRYEREKPSRKLDVERGSVKRAKTSNDNLSVATSLSEGASDCAIEPQKIDAGNFMKMKEIIPTGVQGKAIYGEGNYIIDGPAGTGKSTTVLQKIKLLQLHENVDADKICVIVKHKQVVKPFESLLKGLDIHGVKIYSQSDFVRRYYPGLEEMTADSLKLAYAEVRSLIEEFEEKTDIKELTAFKLGAAQVQDQMRGDMTFQQLLQDFYQDCNRYCERRDALQSKLSDLRASSEKALERFKVKIEEDLLAKKSKSILRRLGLSSSSVEINLEEESKLRKEANKYNDELNKKLSKEAEKHREELKRRESELYSKKEALTNAFLSKDNLEDAINLDVPTSILSRYTNKHFPNLTSLHTVIIDEAQDVNAVNIELIRLQAHNTILAGDESQHEFANGVGRWDEVLFVDEEYSKGGERQIYQLRHNFRQTFELGSVSYNYRQLILNRSIEDIKQDYFDDQIGFPVPSLEYISADGDFYRVIEQKLSYIKSEFTKKFPLVIFYENQKSLERFKELLKGRYSYSIDASLESHSDVMLVSVDKIAGREFPVVIAPLSNVSKHSTIYVMLSRANVDLTLLLGRGRRPNGHLQQLIEADLINLQQASRSEDCNKEVKA